MPCAALCMASVSGRSARNAARKAAKKRCERVDVEFWVPAELLCDSEAGMVSKPSRDVAAIGRACVMVGLELCRGGKPSLIFLLHDQKMSAMKRTAPTAMGMATAATGSLAPCATPLDVVLVTVPLGKVVVCCGCCRERSRRLSEEGRIAIADEMHWI